MSEFNRENYDVQENAVYDANIPTLLNTDPASASNTFNPLVQRLVTNIHAVKNISDTIKIQLEALTGLEIDGLAEMFAGLPQASEFAAGTTFLVKADETQSGQASLWRVEAGSWVSIGVLGDVIGTVSGGGSGSKWFAHTTAAAQTAAQLAEFMAGGDFIVNTHTANATLAGAIRVPGTILERTGAGAANTDFTARGSIRGAQGAQGTPGAPGSNGAQGATGPAGPAGAAPTSAAIRSAILELGTI